MIYSRFINQISSGRQPSLIREMTRILAAASKEMIPLSGGFPNPAMFPVTNITVSVPNTAQINLRYLVNKAQTERYRRIAVPYLQRLLN